MSQDPRFLGTESPAGLERRRVQLTHKADELQQWAEYYDAAADYLAGPVWRSIQLELEAQIAQAHAAMEACTEGPDLYRAQGGVRAFRWLIDMPARIQKYRQEVERDMATIERELRSEGES